MYQYSQKSLDTALKTYVIRATEFRAFFKNLDLTARKHNKLVLRFSLILNLHSREFLLTKYGELLLKLGVLTMKGEVNQCFPGCITLIESINFSYMSKNPFVCS